ncbi:N-6 DNA methylase [Microbacterium xylanilyticum]
MSLSTTVKALQDVMRKDAGVDGDAQRIGQLSWLLFFKIFSDLEIEAELEDGSYESPIPRELQWDAWADEDALGKNAPTGDALLELINLHLFPALKNLDLAVLTPKQRLRGSILRGVFEDAFNYMKSGTLLRQVVNLINHDIDFNQVETRHLFGDIYETILRGLQSAGTAGEFYTPRPVTQFMIEMIDPRLGETVLDPACGTGGFLTGAFTALRNQAQVPQELALAKRSLRGVEKKALPHLLCVTNMMVHGMEEPSFIKHDNTLARPLRDYGPADLVDIIVTNPPFGGMEEDGVENNFPSDIRTRETADLFLVLVMELLKENGRAAIVLPDGTLFGEGTKTRIKERLLSQCNLHTIVRLPAGVFSPYTTIKTNILFFEKGSPTKEVWYYEHQYPEGQKTYTKTRPLRFEEFAGERGWWRDRSESENAWRVSIDDIVARNFNLDFPNPRRALQADAPAAELLQSRAVAEAALVEAKQGLRSDLTGVLGARTATHGVHQMLQNLDLMLSVPEGASVIRDNALRLATRGMLTEQRAEDGDPRELLGNTLLAEGNAPGHWELPASWIWTTLSDVATFRAGRTPSTKDPDMWSDAEGHPWVSIADMPPGGVIARTAKRITDRAASEVFKTPPVSAGSLLMSFKLTIGKVATLGIPAYHNEAIVSINPHDPGCTAYLARVLPLVAPMGTSKAAIKGNTLNKDSLSAMLIPLPPLEEQKRIVAALTSINAHCDVVDRQNEALWAATVGASRALANEALVL